MMNNQGKIAIAQIMILITGVFAFSALIGGLPEVEAQDVHWIFKGKIGSGEPSRFPAGASTLTESQFNALSSSTGGATAMTPVMGSKTSNWVNTELGFDFLAGGKVDALLTSAQWAFAAYLFVQTFGSLLGLDESKTAGLANAAAAGFGVAQGAQVLLGKDSNFFWNTDSTGIGKVGYGTYGLVAAALVFYFTYKDVEEETIIFTCDPWQPPTGGSFCAECNKDGILPCSEYQCRSLGQACELVNAGTEEEKCVWVNPRDVEFPTIEPWLDALLEDHRYTPDNKISPPDRGVIIESTETSDKCVKAFTPLTFGITLNEPAKCKLDYLRKDNFDSMEFFFGGSQLFRQNHTQIMSLPGLNAYEAENIEIRNDGDYELFVRCQDKNGNSNTANFVFKFCVEKGPDTTAPVIVTTNLINGMPIAHNQSSLDLIAYINEPAECRWDHDDREYEDMDNNLACSTSVTEINAQMLYECTTTLTSLRSDEENKFYFRCKDQPSGILEVDRNTNTESYEFIVHGTIPLVISEIVEPNGTVRDSTDPVKVTFEVETSAGAQEGISTCYYSETGEGDQSYIEFFDTLSHTHSQDLFLEEGEYTYFVKCVDLGGNSDEKEVEFEVESDSEAPVVVRAYHEENNLKLVTDEEAECVYDVLSCNYLFEDGISFTTLSETDHFTQWDNSKSFYVKCRDEYGSQPTPADSCSIIVKPFEIFTRE